MTSWPDHEVPNSCTPVLMTRRIAVSGWDKTYPILVHCSAGAGRTGTFIALDMALEQADMEGFVDIAGIINRLRQQRPKMVQTKVNYYTYLIILYCIRIYPVGAVHIPA